MFLKELLKELLRKSLKKLSLLFVFFISFYQAFLSAFMGGSCRFYPSCSAYAKHVYQTQSFFKASILVLRRLLNCHPFGPLCRHEPEAEKFLRKL